MKKIAYFFTFVFLLIFTAFCADDALAARPKWVGTKINYIKLERNKDVKDIKSWDYYRIKFSVTYTNNSDDKILTAIFNKSLTAEYAITWKYNAVANGKSTVKITNVSKMELYPGQSKSMYYYLPLKNMKGGNCFAENINRYFEKIKCTKWWHDFGVSSKPV